ncbi:AAA family ATPase [Limnofasciculus baicalensis]|uniref:Uncharacterized AAA domain-containing protein ycf46 n=1 Tax=Limnofasciculus baicalensis BBK-W-15 TaxID=2699891 RepID=A0AAE3KMB1_9CYAN|nr:AAA family ATPase [Limnofasciculus baicalensis]MCP2729029.1 AAA family ATPase [Limnofasciculus baicalensis BBK-W-15]
MKSNFTKEISEIIRARFPLIYLQTFEEERALGILKDLCASSGKNGLNRPLYAWSQTQGLKQYPDGKIDTSLLSPHQLLDHIEKATNTALYVLLDFHIYLDDQHRTPDNDRIVRRLREIGISLRNANFARTVAIISPIVNLPQSLQKDVMMMDFPLPTQPEIRTALDRLILKQKGGGVQVFLTEEDKQQLCKAALGLTQQEAEGTFARAMASNGALTASDVDLILAQKQQILKKSGALEYVGSDFNLADVGGLENLKKWLDKRNRTWMDEAKRYNLPAPKGVMVTGVPGCGKSLIAKAISSMWKLPLLRFDISSVFGVYVGQSEANMRRALQTAEALAPCILWVDEIEKGLGGASGGEGDSGTTRRVFGNFLTWMQEKQALVFVFATANQINRLPPELLRKGRFDEIFFVDLPNIEERKQIFKVHLRRRLTSPEARGEFQETEQILEELATLSDKFIGAEIEDAITNALYEAFFESRAFRLEDLKRIIKNTPRFADMQADYLQSIRSWAKQRAVSASKGFEQD